MAENVVIIGSGPAGWAASIYAARANLNPLTFEGASTEKNRMQGTLPLGQLALTTDVENYPGFPHGSTAGYLGSALKEEDRPYWVLDGKDQPTEGIQGPELMALMRQQARNFGTRIVTDDIVDVDFSTRPFKLKPSGGDQIEANTVIIATGARANWLGLESEEAYKNRGVSACAVCDGALPQFRNKPLVVVGGGDSAVEEASYLTKYASKVYMIHRRDALRASKIMAQRAFDNDKIEIKWNTQVKEVVGDEKFVTGVKIASTVDDTEETLDASGMFLAIGHTPNTAFLQGKVEMNDKGYIIWKATNRTFTSVDGVFAAGDVADDHYRQAITAAGTGCMAALDAERWLGDKRLI